MKIWVTKYALTRGVFTEEAEVKDNMAVVAHRGRMADYYHGTDWHPAAELAELFVREMMRRKRASLEKQLAALDGKSAKALAGCK